jgi:hypothetical protein
VKFQKKIIFILTFLLTFQSFAFDHNLNCTPSGKSGAKIKSLKFSGKGEFPTATSEDVPVMGTAEEISFSKFKFKNVKIIGTASGSPKGSYFELKSDGIKDIQSIFISSRLDGESGTLITDNKGKEFKMNCN